ncbi:MAG TPA: F0F1 ATP synthase subunit delta [Streptosporangiaceae bacterium]|nr:F0F1 ATP synthase subunit delta [Streptosporangiaceae bacterium]
MRGVSRASLAEVEEQLVPYTTGAAEATSLSDDLFAVATLLSGQPALRRALADPSRSASSRAGLATALLSGKVSDSATSLTAAVASARWSAPADVIDAAEQLAVQSLLAAAEHEGNLDDLEDELFRFGRIVSAQPQLRIAVTNPFVPAEAKRQLLDGLLTGKVTPQAQRLITQAAVNPRGRSLDVSLEEYTRLAARRRERLVAEVHVARPLSDEQRRRLAAALAARYGSRVHLNIVLDPKVAGGLTVRIGDDLIDASVASRLAEAGRRLVA